MPVPGECGELNELSSHFDSSPEEEVEPGDCNQCADIVKILLMRMSHSEGYPMISVQCKCGQKLRVKPEYAGRKARCPACSEAVQIPDTIEPSVESPRRSHAEKASQDTVPVAQDRKATRPVIYGEIMPNEQAEVQPRAYSRPPNVEVNVDIETSRGAHSLGVASLVVAIL